MTLRELYNYSRHELKALEFPAMETTWLTEKFFGKDRQDILVHGEEIPEEEKQQEFLWAVAKRKEGYPLQYILGFWYFMGMRLNLMPGVLVPREDTEVLVNRAAEFIGDKRLFGADLCSGSGAVALGITQLCPFAGLEVFELYPKPLTCLKVNTELYGDERINIVKADVLKGIEYEKRYDFIVSNPPYVRPEEMEGLQQEVKNEPREALVGGDDGLVFYRAICEKWTKALKPGGLMAFEIGETQAEAVSEIMRRAGFSQIKMERDMAELPRVVSGILT